MAMTASDTHGAIDAVWRIESARIIASLARMVRDVGLAEELAQDALVAALERWPQAGVPDNRGARLIGVAKHRAIDRLRQKKLHESKEEELGREIDGLLEMAAPDLDAAIDDDIGDDLLRLVFIACHPVLSTEARVALTLRLLGGLTTEEIARAFLVPEPTIAQRIVRAKRTLAEARVPFEAPRADELAARLSSVLEVIYLVFNEGYSATAGDHWMRPQLCEEALRLGRILAEFAPHEPEVHGLVPLRRSRRRARGRGSARRASPYCSLTKTARAGINCSSVGVSRRSSEPRRSAARLGPTRCRPRSPPRARVDRRRRSRSDECGASRALPLDSRSNAMRSPSSAIQSRRSSYFKQHGRGPVPQPSAQSL
jgi:RNA polymerase sigma factor (sigma-70 family)